MPRVSAFLLFRMKCLIHVDPSLMDLQDQQGGEVSVDDLSQDGASDGLHHFV